MDTLSVLFLFLCFTCCDVLAIESPLPQTKSYADHMVLRLWPQNEQQVYLLANHLPVITNETADFWTHPNYLKRPVDVMVPSNFVPTVLNFARAHGFNGTKILIKDVQKWVLKYLLQKLLITMVFNFILD